jgi:hypothetical protein
MRSVERQSGGLAIVKPIQSSVPCASDTACLLCLTWPSGLGGVRSIASHWRQGSCSFCSTCLSASFLGWCGGGNILKSK